MSCAAPVARGPPGGSAGLVLQVRYEGAHGRAPLGAHGAGEGLADGAGEPGGGLAQQVAGLVGAGGPRAPLVAAHGPAGDEAVRPEVGVRGAERLGGDTVPSSGQLTVRGTSRPPWNQPGATRGLATVTAALRFTRAAA
ncbi:hypothetical protein ACFY71_06135 [Streptomyces cinerochromogenes]|uniref:Uncharacterized protein n=1 Tax=Streptomyces cinerochromogenes TaxID=66422 RepID=A0ABW7BAP9_9ACTN